MKRFVEKEYFTVAEIYPLNATIIQYVFHKRYKLSTDV